MEPDLNDPPGEAERDAGANVGAAPDAGTFSEAGNVVSAADDDAEEPEFKWLGDFVRKAADVGPLATAVESRGINGYDRFGRYKKFEPESDGVKRALNELARVYSILANPDPRYAEDFWSAWGPLDNILYDFGWPASECPDIGSMTSGLQPGPAPGPKRKGGRPSNDAELVAVLWAVIRGRFHCAPHPGFASNLALIDHIVNKTSFNGLARDTLKDKLSAAAKRMRVTEEG